MPERLSLDDLLASAGRKTAILDANLLVPLISLRTGTDISRNLKRVRTYSFEDLKLLAFVLGQFQRVVTTSAVLAEASNLANELTGTLRDKWFLNLSVVAAETDEEHVGTKIIGTQGREEMVRFGFTDAVLAKLSDSHVLITADFRLAGFLGTQSRNVINFNQIQLLRLT